MNGKGQESLITNDEPVEHRRPYPGAFECVCGSGINHNKQYDTDYCTKSNQ